MRGKLIVIEGTDASGKETQSKRLYERLKKEDIPIFEMQFPRYDTPTGKIIAGPYLGKKEYSESYFEEGASRVNPKVASLYFAADRLYNISDVTRRLDKGINVILDRYVISNMAHQAGKIKDIDERNEMIEFLDKLEFGLLEMPKPDLVVFLHMPLKYSNELKAIRNEPLDGHETNNSYLKRAEETYLYLAKKYNFVTIECVENKQIKTVDKISDEIYKIVKENLNGKQNS